MFIKALMKDYQWKDKALKRKYQIFDFSAVGLAIVILLLLKFVDNSMPYVLITIGVIVVLEWYCFRIKKQDGQIREG